LPPEVDSHTHGITRGSLVSSDAGPLTADPNHQKTFIQTTSDHSLWLMLMAGRLDAVIIDQLKARWKLREMGLSEMVVEDGYANAAEPAYFAFSKASFDPEQVRRFDAAIRAMRADGTLADVAARYGIWPGVVGLQRSPCRQVP
jgi:ABC-type amino acid transport substrate-binding protein